jgi:hypothetical protein
MALVEMDPGAARRFYQYVTPHATLGTAGTCNVERAGFVAKMKAIIFVGFMLYNNLTNFLRNSCI